jgi:hypothetical protein
MNNYSNRDRLLSMVQNREPNKSPRPLVYDLTKYGGNTIMISNYYYTEDDLRRFAQEDIEEERKWEQKRQEALSKQVQ